ARKIILETMTYPDPHNNEANPTPDNETSSFEPVRSAYHSWGTPPEQTPGASTGLNTGASTGTGAQAGMAAGTPAWASWDTDTTRVDTVQPEKKQKRSVGLGTALALMVVGSVATGSVVGVASTQFGDDTGGSGVVNALDQPSSERAVTAEPGSAEQVADQVLPSVVSIQALTRNSASEGSGSIISSDGYVMTNNHVVAGVEQNGVLQVTMS